ncbi:MAG: hypothetical protein QW476_02700 [Candidatus Bathyarchaeia archaeon]|nr:hypothetical protein [Candidatus Bathyarchaeota archaeon]
MNVLIESSYAYQVNENHEINLKICVERKILIDLIKNYEKIFNQETLNFENIIVNVVESKLREIFGDNILQAVKTYLEKKFSLKLQDAVEKPEIFFASLEKIFGKSVYTIEKLILKEIQNKIKP